MTGRRRWFLWAATAYVVILLSIALGLTGLYRGASERLDEAMGRRLADVAGTLAAMADGEKLSALAVGDDTQAPYLESLRMTFDAVRSQADLAEITLTDADGVVLFSTPGRLAPGEMDAYLALDRPAVESALRGVPLATPMTRIGGLYQKSAHAAVMKDDFSFDGAFPVAVVTVSGSPDFFDALDQLRTGAYVTSAAVILVLVFMGWFLFRIQASLDRYRASIQRQENLAAMGRMTAGIAHEIRNPLGIIRGAGQHLQRVLADAGIEDEVADFIPEEVDRLDRILSGYLAFGTDRPADAEPVEMNRAVRRSLELMDREFRQAGIDVGYRPADMEVTVKGDPVRLQQVLLNLLINARDAMPGGGELAVRVDGDDRSVRVEITDSGKGLQGADPGEIFEPFWTSKEKGSGLGLAMSRRIVEDMQGSLNVADRPEGSGATAVLEIPSESTGFRSKG